MIVALSKMGNAGLEQHHARVTSLKLMQVRVIFNSTMHLGIGNVRQLPLIVADPTPAILTRSALVSYVCYTASISPI